MNIVVVLIAAVLCSVSTVAVIRFSGWATGSVVSSKTDELLASLRSCEIEVVGAPSLNQYNPPWTLPFLRRNEVMVEMESPAFSAAAPVNAALGRC